MTDNESKKHILVVTQYFYPEQFRMNDICTEWVKRGYQVTVITGIPNYPQGKYHDGYGLFKQRKEKWNGIDIIRLFLIPRGHNPVMLSLNYLSFAVSGFFWKLCTEIRADYVFIFQLSPMTLALPGVWYAKKRKVPAYLYVQDLWPESVEVITGIRNRVIIRSIGRMADSIYARCTRIFTTSRDFVNAIHDRGVSEDKIEYWPQYAEDLYSPQAKNAAAEVPESDAMNITFTGNVGNAQGLDILPKAASILKKQNITKKIRFNIIGDGRYKDELVRMVESMDVSEMFHFTGKQPAEKIPGILAASDLAFLSLMGNPIFDMTVPAKLQSYMACGIPILAAAAGETAAIIRESNSGTVCAPGDVEQLARDIIELSSRSKEELAELGANARAYNDQNFKKQILMDRMDHYFK